MAPALRREIPGDRQATNQMRPRPEIRKYLRVRRLLGRYPIYTGAGWLK